MVFARASSPTACTVTSRQAGAEPRLLEIGRPIERELRRGESHAYQIPLAADQYLEAVVEQRSINVVVTAFDPAGKKLMEIDNAKTMHGSEVLALIAEDAGPYRVEVRPAMKLAVLGRYTLNIIALRSPTADERSLEAARRLSEESRSLRQKGKYNEAVPLEERALAIREKVLGADHSVVAKSLHALAVLYDDQADYAKAEPLNVRALAIREKALGPDHPDVARSLFNLAWIYLMGQDFAKAEECYQRAVATQEKALGADHPDVATMLNDFAILYERKGDYDQAIAGSAGGGSSGASSIRLFRIDSRRNQGR